MNDLIKKLKEQATSYTWNGNDVTEELDEEKFAELIVNDVLGCYHAIDTGNRVEGTEDFVKAVVKRYDLGKKK